MKIKTRLQVNIILTIILSITVGLSIYMAIQSVKEGSRTEIIAAEIVKGMAELEIITHEYLLYPGERSMMQWQSRYDSLIKTITAAEFKRPSERIILNEILQDLSRSKAAFTELFRSYGIVQEFGGPKIAFSPDLRNRLIGELLVKSQATVSSVFQLQKAIQTELVTAQQRAGFLIVIFLIIFTVLIMPISLWINRSIGVPIAQLERGTQIIGAGNLDHKVGTVAKDEIGQLSRAFDKMTGDLKKTTASIVDLNREIAERKRAEEALREAEKNWHNSFNSLEDVMIIIDKDYNIENINDNGLGLLGKSKKEVIGKKCYKIIHDTETPAEYCPFRKALETKKPESVERHEDMFDKYFSIKSSPIFDKNGEIVRFVDLMSDITERKQAEEKFEIQRAQIKSLFDYSGEAMALLDLENHIIDANLAFEEVFGYPLEEAHGKVIEDLICPERFYYTEAKELDRQAMQGIKGAEIIRMRKDGKEINVRVSAGPIKVGGTITGRFAVFDDITERKQAEEALQHERDKLQDALDNVRTLSGMLPICSNCKKIRDDKGYWSQIESYIAKHSEADFTHSICPECAKKLYPDFYKGD